MIQSTDAFPLNFGFTGKGNTSRAEGDSQELYDQIEAGAIGCVQKITRINCEFVLEMGFWFICAQVNHISNSGVPRRSATEGTAPLIHVIITVITDGDRSK